jgi:hypothetical protein
MTSFGLSARSAVYYQAGSPLSNIQKVSLTFGTVDKRNDFFSQNTCDIL